VLGTAHPSRDAAGQRVDVGFQWGVVLFVIGGVVADDNHHRHPGAARIVQVGKAVTQSGAQVQEHRGRPIGDARVTVGCAGGHTFEKR
jgi:hypothetical protein